MTSRGGVVSYVEPQCIVFNARTGGSGDGALSSGLDDLTDEFWADVLKIKVLENWIILPLHERSLCPNPSGPFFTQKYFFCFWGDWMPSERRKSASKSRKKPSSPDPSDQKYFFSKRVPFLSFGGVRPSVRPSVMFSSQFMCLRVQLVTMVHNQTLLKCQLQYVADALGIVGGSQLHS